ncbi:Agamous-like MADS-box protein AGL62 [Linum perenne]
MEKRVDSVKRSTTFSKRRHGLFNKVLELFLFCGSEVAVFVSFPSNNRRFESLAHPSVDFLLDGCLSPYHDQHQNTNKLGLSICNKINQLKKSNQNTCCWNYFTRQVDKLVEDRRLDELKALLDLLRNTKAKAISKLELASSPVTMVLDTQSIHHKQDDAPFNCSTITNNSTTNAYDDYDMLGSTAAEDWTCKIDI